ncbi:hypothetical protein ABPG74_002971 [Tetrahymena malaccensis]
MEKKLILLLCFAININISLADCSNKSQFTDQSNFCYTCNQTAPYISYNSTANNGTCVQNCLDGQYYNSTNYCLSCQNSQIPTQDKTACVNTCEDVGQILNTSGNNCIQKNSCTSGLFILLTNNRTQCVSNCTSNSQFLDIKNYCYTCNSNAPYISYNSTANNGTCVQNCLDGQYYNSTNYCLSCQNSQIPTQDKTACVNKCEDVGQILNTSGNNCLQKNSCTSGLFILLTNNRTQCVSNCTSNSQFLDIKNYCYTCNSNAPYISYNSTASNGTCVQNCLDGQYYNSTNYCLSCQNSQIPTQDKTACVNKCEDVGQILNTSGNNCIQKNSCTSGLFILLTNNRTQCVSNCTSNSQFLDIKNYCYTCNSNAPYISYNSTANNGTCVQNCQDGQYYNSTNYCLSCQNNQIPAYNKTACLNKCEDAGQILNTSGNNCIQKNNCTSSLFTLLTNNRTQCVSNCTNTSQFLDNNNYCYTCNSSAPYISYNSTANNGTCVQNCQDGQYYNSTNYCLSCQNSQIPTQDKTACVNKCEDVGQILNTSGNNCIQKNSCTSGLFILLTNNRTQCVSNCTSNSQFLDIKNYCYTCNSSAPYISYNSTANNGTCVQNCQDGQYYNSTNYCLSCQNNQIPAYNKTACLNKCEDAGQILNIAGNNCIQKNSCTSGFTLLNNRIQCVSNCTSNSQFLDNTNYCYTCNSSAPYISYNSTANNGTCVQNCQDGQYYNSTNYCLSCQNSQIPTQDKTACVNKCEDVGQILNTSGNNCIQKNSCTSGLFILLTNNRTQCVSNCTSNSQFLDIKNYCYTCNSSAPYISYNSSANNGTCVQNCQDGQYYNSTNYCLSCQNNQIPAYNKTVCLNKCEDAGQILNTSGNNCIQKNNCTSSLFTLLTNNRTQCVSNCTNTSQFLDNNNYCYTCNSSAPYISYNSTANNGTCVQNCQDGQYYNSTNYCLSCQNNQIPDYNKTLCLKSCKDEGQILSSTGKSCIYQQNCTSNIFQINNGTIQCISNCNNQKQYLDSSNFCYTCNDTAKYIQYDNQKKNGTCVSNCGSGQYYNSTNYCISCNQNQFVSSNGTACVSSCNKGELINQNKTMCIPQSQCQDYISSDGLSCNSQCNQYEYVVQSNNQKYCKVCSNYLSIDSNQQVNCINKCNPQEMVYYFTNNQVKYKQCVDSALCKTKKISASNSNICSDTCISPEVDNGSSTCSLTCPQGQYQSPKNSTCSSTCQNYISSDKKLCIESCGQILEVVGDSNACTKCSSNTYFSSSNGTQACIQISNSTQSLTLFKNSVISIINSGINTVQALQQIQENISQYISSSYDQVISIISSKNKTTSDDKQQVQQAVSDIFSINQQILNNISPSEGKQSVVTGSSQLKVIGQASQPGYKFSQILNSSDIQNGNTTSLLEQDNNQTSQQQTQLLQLAYVSTNIYCDQDSCAQKQPLFMLQVQNVQSQQRMLQQQQTFQILYQIQPSQDPNKLICQNYNQQGVFTWSQGQVSNGQISCQISYSSSIYYDEQCQYVNQQYCQTGGDSDKGLSGVQIFGITISCIAFVGLTAVFVVIYIRRKKGNKKVIKTNSSQNLQTNNLMTEQPLKGPTENKYLVKNDEEVALDQIAIQ